MTIPMAPQAVGLPARFALEERQGILDPGAIAENYWRLHVQPKSAWSHELDLRPWIEK